MENGYTNTQNWGSWGNWGFRPNWGFQNQSQQPGNSFQFGNQPGNQPGSQPGNQFENQFRNPAPFQLKTPNNSRIENSRIEKLEKKVETVENEIKTLRHTCSFLRTGKIYEIQGAFRCVTCEKNGYFKKPDVSNPLKPSYNSLCCVFCALNFHNGHQMIPLGYISMYCDNGEKLKLP